MIYLIDPKKVTDGRCILNYPLYGIPCYDFCRVLI